MRVLGSVPKFVDLTLGNRVSNTEGQNNLIGEDSSQVSPNVTVARVVILQIVRSYRRTAVFRTVERSPVHLQEDVRRLNIVSCGCS